MLHKYLVDGLLTLLVFLGLLLHLLSLLYVINELEQVPQVQNHRLGLERPENMLTSDINLKLTFCRSERLFQ